MPALIDLRKRIKSIRNTQQITQAMKTVSTAKFKKAQRQVLEGRPYWHNMPQLMKEIAFWAQDQGHPFLAKRKEKKVTCLVLTSDKGLAFGRSRRELFGRRRELSAPRRGSPSVEVAGPRSRAVGDPFPALDGDSHGLAWSDVEQRVRSVLHTGARSWVANRVTFPRSLSSERLVHDGLLRRRREVEQPAVMPPSGWEPHTENRIPPIPPPRTTASRRGGTAVEHPPKWIRGVTTVDRFPAPAG